MPLKSLIARNMSESSMTTPDFFGSAVKAMHHTPDIKRRIVVQDMAEQLGCDVSALDFLLMTEASDEDIAVPEYRDVLLAAE